MSYINQKGYVIPKSNLSISELALLKQELTLIPKENYAGPTIKPQKIYVYRENDQKIYIPRFYGIKKYGNPPKTDLSSGDSIDVTFAKPIRDYQTKIVQIYLDHVNTTCTGGILEVPCGRGKTVMALKICAELKKKTLILVHKEFLMNQWIERIAEFVPNARVGKIQAKTFDISDKDIVIGMIQTIYDKQYPINTFSSFGLTIIDEVHRVGSEEFSKTLLNIVTPYMLGISATVERKDGLTDILYMFIGDKIYSEARDDEDEVQVRAIQYEHDDEKYNKVEVDMRDKVKYSTMISKISDFFPRQEFLVQILRDLIFESDEKQIMVLSHKRDLLAFLKTEIEKEEFATCGLYVGGMKQDKLQETEGKQIVLATYAMAAEALDIKTLNTLVMVSPKTDIVQSVGRILRTRGPGKIIVDVIDSHEVFQNQWKKRRAYYKNANYHIQFIKNDTYSGMLDSSNWKQVYHPKTKTESVVKEKKECLIEWSNINWS
jgi:superfamily II DNA or RNA helicase